MTSDLGAVQDLALAHIETLLAEEAAVRPKIWSACEDRASNEVRLKAQSGDLTDFAKLGQQRETLTRKYAIEQAVNYALGEGMTREELVYLFHNVMGEGYAAFSAGKPPERAVIDELRVRIYVIVTPYTPTAEAI